MTKPKWADLADGPEHERLIIVGSTAASGQTVAFFVDDDTVADRYIEKLTRMYPIQVLWRGPGPVPDTVMVKIGPTPKQPT